MDGGQGRRAEEKVREGDGRSVIITSPTCISDTDTYIYRYTHAQVLIQRMGGGVGGLI